MARVSYGVMAYDPVTQNGYINSIGSTIQECAVNLSMIELTDEVTNRLVFLPVEIYCDPE